MNKNHEKCDLRLLNDYYDKELSERAREKIEIHVQNCPSCRQLLKDNNVLSNSFTSLLKAEISGRETKNVQDRVLDGIYNKQNTWQHAIQNFLLSKKRLVPIAVTALLVVFVFTFFKQPVIVAEPSAIINSFSGDVSSVVIFETPNLRQTIIWYNEDIISDSDNNETQKTDNTFISDNFLIRTARLPMGWS